MILTELKLMENIQKFNFSKQMRLISKPFNSITFTIIIIILSLYKILNMNDIILLTKGIIAANILKYVFRRTRPYKESNIIKNYSGNTHKLSFDIYSFPSSHTFISIFFSLVILNKFPSEFVFNIVGILVGFSRVFLGVHYPTDIIGGMLFGFIFYNILN